MARRTDIVNETLIRRRLTVRGRVQGVGFRPFVYRLATEMYLSGLVGNDSHGAFIEVEGPADGVAKFEARLQSELPPLARISSLSSLAVPLRSQPGFRIEISARGDTQDAEMTPDAAICPDCLAELFAIRDRRFRYPFINCMYCGPRYSIIRAVPYDRANTTMAKFRMCPACQAEYDNPANRRFHAQPNACAACGPRLWLADANGDELSCDPIRTAAARLREGEIVAVKGIGGFHLACRADSDAAVLRLRERKGREAKAFAVMVKSLEEVETLAEVDAASSAALVSVERPIVLMPKRDRRRIADSVAPDSDYYGLMLPYTPLHHLLFAEDLPALVMTSANPTEEPLCRDNDEAVGRLAGIADAFLLNDRDIERRVDDSVVLAMSHDGGCVVPIRRARGFAPAPVSLLSPANDPILAVGGELKSTVCLLAGGQAVVSEHLGELSNAAAYRNFVQTIGCFQELLRLDPRIVAYDMHPDYAATRYARSLGLREVPVQHHHAHVVSCMAENGITGRVVGLSCDGTGYGTDGAIWGCEILVSDEAEFERAGHLDYFPLLGGDAAAQDTWRPAAGLLRMTYGDRWREEAEFCLRRIENEAVELAAARLASGVRIPMTSSLGRLFDAVAFLLGVCDRNRYEAEAAMKLEALARRHAAVEPLPFDIHDDSSPGGPLRLDARPMIRELLAQARAGQSPGSSARAFHETVAAMLITAVKHVAERTGLDRLVLSGGCFANRLLSEIVTGGLTAAGLSVYMHQLLPTGDGGIALGQAVAAAERIRRTN